MPTIPADLRYTKDHEWIRLDGETATIGVTDFAQGELGSIVFVTMPAVGEHFEAEAAFGTIEAVKTVSDLFMPVAGTVAEVNTALDAAPESVNDDPYGAGWLVRVTVDDPASVGALLDADAYAAHAG